MRMVKLLSMGLLLAGAACAPPPWQPPAPAGRTWQYDAQGAFREARSFGVGKTLGGGSYGYFFGVKAADIPPGTEPDQFWRQQSVSSYHFNAHLAGFGERVSPGPNGPVVGRPPARAAGGEEE